MKSDLISILLGFIEGFGLIISPCILPILPIILAGSLEGSKKRPLGIICGFTLSFALVAYFSRQFVQASGIDLNLIRHLSYGLLVLFGLIMLSSSLSKKFAELTNFTTRLKLGGAEDGFFSGLFLGSLVAIVWTPCAGPILAAVIVQTVLQKTTLVSFFILLAFGLGAAIPMLFIAYFGRQLIDSFSFFHKEGDFFRKILGAIILLSVAYMVYAEGGLAVASVKQSTLKTATVLEEGLSASLSGAEN